MAHLQGTVAVALGLQIGEGGGMRPVGVRVQAGQARQLSLQLRQAALVQPGLRHLRVQRLTL